VPALVLDDGTTVAEVPAIWRFLEETYPEHPLLGSEATSKALITMWERRVELDGLAPTMEGVRNAAAGLKGRALSGPHDYDQIPGLVERSKRRVEDFYADFDTRLEQAPFVAGAAFSAADITALVTVDFATAALKMPIPRRLPRRAAMVWDGGRTSECQRVDVGLPISGPAYPAVAARWRWCL
jgi:glutathione S-transferase